MFDALLTHPTSEHRLKIRWSQHIPALVRMPLFSNKTGLGYVVSYKEKTREYLLQCFNPETSEIVWSTNVRNGGYGSHAVGDAIVVVPTNFVNITGIDAVSGEIVWEHETDARVRSPIAYVGGEFIFSSGQNIIRITETGEVRHRSAVPEHFFFGLVKCVNDVLFSLATYTNRAGRSQLTLIALSLDGAVKWKADLGAGQIISSDTSGFAVTGNHIYCCADKTVHCIDINDGSFVWSKTTSDTIGRQMPTISGEKLFVPSVGGRIFCFSINDGALLWTFNGSTIASTPVSILGDLACVCLDGQLHLLDIETGRPFDQIPTGHSPYSAITFWNDKAYVGGGDPPYNGRLYCFDCMNRNSTPDYLCTINSLMPLQGRDDFFLQVEVSNIQHEIQDLILDASVIAAQHSNGGIYKLQPLERSGNRFTFLVPIRTTIVPGIYCVDFHFLFEIGETVCRTGLITIEAAELRPKRHVISQISPISQTNPLNSGAAAMQMVQNYYGQPLTDQDAIRDMVEYIRDKADYEPFNIWRLILRRVISSNAKSKEYLPEYKPSPASNSTVLH